MSISSLVLIPSYNTGPKLIETVREARRFWPELWVVIDGSTDGSDEVLSQEMPDLKMITLPKNQGKGAAILAGLQEAVTAGFSHVLTMDADGQHPANQIPIFMAAAQADPAAMILGQPIFGKDAPRERIWGRKIANACVTLETFCAGVGDSLFGFRLYPALPLLKLMQASRHMRRYDFDTEAVVRLSWQRVKPINIRIPVRYFQKHEGGVSHFRYGRDNLLLSRMHWRLAAGMAKRLPFFRSYRH